MTIALKASKDKSSKAKFLKSKQSKNIFDQEISEGEAAAQTCLFANQLTSNLSETLFSQKQTASELQQAFVGHEIAGDCIGVLGFFDAIHDYPNQVDDDN